MSLINFNPHYFLFYQNATEHSLCSIGPFPRLNLCFVSIRVVCSLFVLSSMDIGSELSHLPSRKESVPKRMCQTCGLLLTLDHFISLYTESSTANCDLCRKKQREAYRGLLGCIDSQTEKQLKKRKLRLSRLHSLSHSASSVSPTSSPSIDSASSSSSPVPCSMLPCVPTMMWIPCDFPSRLDSVPVARVLIQTRQVLPKRL